MTLLAAAGLVGLVGPSTAAAVRPRPGATYEAISRFGTLVMAVHRDGRAFSFQRASNDLEFPCRGGATALTTVDSAPAQIRVSRTGAFTVAIAQGDGTAMHFNGRFSRGGRARGRVSWHGAAHTSYSACGAAGVWNAHVLPPPPRRVRFVGTTSAGTRVSFYRTVERHPIVGGFDFGTLGATCPDGSTEPESLTTEDTFHVQRSAFSGVFTTPIGDEGSLSGRFASPTHATGDVQLTARDGCNTPDVTWSADRVP